jgi:hypothetical protein
MAVAFIVYFLWYLSWPVSEGEVESIADQTIEGIGITRKRKVRIIRYRYIYDNIEYYSVRQGLFMKFGFSPIVDLGDRIKMSVCTKLPDLSCPRRVALEACVLMGIVLFCALLGAFFYWNGFIA